MTMKFILRFEAEGSGMWFLGGESARASTSQSLWNTWLSEIREQLDAGLRVLIWKRAGRTFLQSTTENRPRRKGRERRSTGTPWDWYPLAGDRGLDRGDDPPAG
jgi:hypothetical protein